MKPQHTSKGEDVPQLPVWGGWHLMMGWGKKKGHHGGVLSSQKMTCLLGPKITVEPVTSSMKDQVISCMVDKNSFPSKREMSFCTFLLVCMSYYIGFLLERNMNSLFAKAKKENPGGIPRNPWGMHNLGRI